MILSLLMSASTRKSLLQSLMVDGLIIRPSLSFSSSHCGNNFNRHRVSSSLSLARFTTTSFTKLSPSHNNYNNNNYSNKLTLFLHNRHGPSLLYPDTILNNNVPFKRLYSKNPNAQQRQQDESLIDTAFLQDVTSVDDFFAAPVQFPTFASLGIQSPILLKRVHKMLNGEASRPSAVQAASFAAIGSGKDVSIGAETGSGKTLAYLLPLVDDILTRKQRAREEKTGKVVGRLGYDYARAVILVPNKELANQVLRMAMELCGGPRSVVWGSDGETVTTVWNRNVNEGDHDEYNDEMEMDECDIVRLGIMPGGFKNPEDYKPIRMAINDPMSHAPLDIIITTPASLGPIGVNPKNINMFADIETVVIDEADMLLDGGYLRPLNDVLLGFKRADKLDASFGVKKTQHILVAATLPDMGLKSAEAYVQRKFPFATRVTMKGMHNARHYGLKDRTVWIQDDINEDMPKKKRMERLIQILEEEPSNDGIGLKGEKVMIFLNTAGDVDSAAAALGKAGISAVPFHAKVPLAERTENLGKFRKYDPTTTSMEENDQDSTVPILVCTDLAARGLDIPGVTSVVQLQFAGNVVSHLHRMGRCGRAGKRDGKGVIFYGEVESELVEVVKQAEMEQEKMVLKGNDIEEIQEEEKQVVAKQVNPTTAGKVENAFSRKRGFTKKRKKLARKSRDDDNDNDEEFYN